MSAHVVDDVTKSDFWRPFEEFSSTVPASEQERRRQAGRTAAMDGVLTGYRELLKSFNQEYLSAAN